MFTNSFNSIDKYINDLIQQDRLFVALKIYFKIFSKNTPGYKIDKVSEVLNSGGLKWK